MRKILLADDDEDESKFFEEATRLLNCHLISACDGLHLMKELQTGVEGNCLPDYIFLDLDMPLKDGVDCLREIKEHDHLKTIPIIIYSITAQQKTIDLIYSLGANLFLPKPDNVKQLVFAVQKILTMDLHTLSIANREEFLRDDMLKSAWMNYPTVKHPPSQSTSEPVWLDNSSSDEARFRGLH